MTRSALIDISPFDLHATFDMQLVGRFDPTGARGVRALRKVQVDEDGRLVVWRLSWKPSGMLVEVQGDDGRLLDALTRQFPLADGADSFEPAHPLLATLGSRHRGLRLMRVPWIFDVAAATVLQQRVRWQTGFSDFRRIALRWGTRAHGVVAFPTPSRLAEVSPAHLEAMGIDPKRARTLHLLAQAAARHRFLGPDTEPAAVVARLLAIRGIGPWTAGLVAGLALGDPDAVPVGDLHIPSMVTSALAGEPEGTDQRMLELLAAYPGQRFRVIRLLLWAARRGPLALGQLQPAQQTGGMDTVSPAAPAVAAGQKTRAGKPPQRRVRL